MAFVKRIPALGISAMFMAAVASAQTVWVDDDAPNDPAPGNKFVSDPLENGSADHPFDEIQEALNVAISGSRILVRPGTYWENITFPSGKSLDLQSDADGNSATEDFDPENTIIDGSKQGSVITFYMIPKSIQQVLNGFTVTNGAKAGAGMNIQGASPEIGWNWIINNDTGSLSNYSGGGVLISGLAPIGPPADVWLRNNLIRGNKASGSGGGVYCIADCDVLFHNNIIAKNHASSVAGGVYCAPTTSSYHFVNDTIAYNTSGGFSGIDGFSAVELWNVIVSQNSLSASMNVNYSMTDTLYPGVGNLFGNPAFVNASANDFHLLATSPCVDSGTNTPTGLVLPDLDMDGQPRTFNGTVDMGADEYYPLAITSVTPPSGSSCSPTQVILNGTGFLTLTPPVLVYLDGMPCTNVLVLSNSQISCTFPAAPPALNDDALPVTVSDPVIPPSVLDDGWRYLPNLQVDSTWMPSQTVTLTCKGTPNSRQHLWASLSLLPTPGIPFWPSCLNYLLAPPTFYVPFPVYLGASGETFIGFPLPATWPPGMAVWFQGIEEPKTSTNYQCTNTDF